MNSFRDSRMPNSPLIFGFNPLPLSARIRSTICVSDNTSCLAVGYQNRDETEYSALAWRGIRGREEEGKSLPHALDVLESTQVFLAHDLSFSLVVQLTFLE